MNLQAANMSVRRCGWFTGRGFLSGAELNRLKAFDFSAIQKKIGRTYAKFDKSEAQVFPGLSRSRPRKAHISSCSAQPGAARKKTLFEECQLRQGFSSLASSTVGEVDEASSGLHRPQQKPDWQSKPRGRKGQGWRWFLPCSREELLAKHSTNVTKIATYVHHGGELDRELLLSVPVNLLNLAIKRQTSIRSARRLLLALVQEGAANEHSLVSFFSMCNRSGSPGTAVRDWRLDLRVLCRQRKDAKHGGALMGPIAAGMLLHAACCSGKGALPFEVYRELAADGLTVNIRGLNCYLMHCAKVRELEHAVSAYKELCGRQRGARRDLPRPDRYTYSALLRVAVACGSLPLAWRIHGAMQRDHGATDAFVWGSLASAYAKFAEHSAARAVLEQMKEKWPKGREELLSGYNALLAAYAEAGSFPEALRVYREEIRAAGLWPDSISCMCVLNAAHRSRSQPVEAVEALGEDARATGCVKTMTALLNGYRSATGLSDSERLDRVLEVLDYMKSEGLKPTMTTHNSVMLTYLECAAPRQAVEYYKNHVEGSATRPDEITFKILVQAYELLGLPHKVAEVQELEDSMRIISGRYVP